jgi:PAS domain S-box-containing protein
VQYVDRTGKLVILETANRDRFAHDVYLQTHQPASFLCVPIFNRRELIAILYVENSLTAKAFTSDRVELLNVLCAQAAISLENARLYQQSQQAEAALQEREQFLSSIYDGAEMCIFVLDVASDGNFRYAGWNTLAERVFGVRNTDVIGKTSIEVFGVEQGESMDRWLAQAVGTGAFVYAEQYIPLQGQDSWWFSTLNPLKNEQGQVYRIIGTGFDVSDRKRAEAATLQKSQELNQALQDLQNTQLQMVQSEKMASLGNLVAGIAHEINNPIGFLNGSINNAKDYVQDLLAHLALYQQHCAQAVAPLQTHAEDIDLEFLSEDLPKLLNSMKGATDRIKGISTSLRTFSRADTDHKVSADLHGGIDSTLLILKYRLKANEHRPAIEVIQDYGDLPAIDCFPGQLNQVFMNILANAIDMFDELAQQSSLAELEENPQIITIQTAIVSKQDSIEIRIRDNGKGMTEQVKAKIFDHLFTTKDVGKGTGLGLAIARQIVVEKHGGSLEVQSALGRGSEFCIRLPIADSATNAA